MIFLWQSKNKKLAQIEKEEKEKIFNEAVDKLKKYRINIISIGKLDDVVSKVIELLNQHSELINRKNWCKYW